MPEQKLAQVAMPDASCFHEGRHTILHAKEVGVNDRVKGMCVSHVGCDVIGPFLLFGLYFKWYLIRQGFALNLEFRLCFVYIMNEKIRRTENVNKFLANRSLLDYL